MSNFIKYYQTILSLSHLQINFKGLTTTSEDSSEQIEKPKDIESKSEDQEAKKIEETVNNYSILTQHVRKNLILNMYLLAFD